MKIIQVKQLLVLFITVLLMGCVTAPKSVLPEKRFFWPSEPDEPKIEWIASYSSDLDFREKTLMSEIVGDDSSVQFSRPVSVAGDGEGRFVVSDQELAQVFMIDLKKQKAVPLGGNDGAASFSKPSGIAVDSEGLFYVADTVTRKIFVVNKENILLRVMDFSAQAKSIGALAIDRARALLVIPDAKGSKLLIYSLSGELRSTIEGKGYFSFPNAVAVGVDGSYYIADSFNATIVHFTSEGKYISAFGKRGDSPGNLALVTGIAVDSEDHIYVTDGRLNNITLFDKDGITLMVIGGQHSVRSGNIGRGGFLVPQGISIDINDRIYVADSLNRRVQLLQYLSKKYLDSHPLAPAK